MSMSFRYQNHQILIINPCAQSTYLKKVRLKDVGAKEKSTHYTFSCLHGNKSKLFTLNTCLSFQDWKKVMISLLDDLYVQIENTSSWESKRPINFASNLPCTHRENYSSNQQKH